MKLFTLQEANDLISVVRPILLKIQARHNRIASFRDAARAAANSAQFGGGGMESGSVYVKSLYELGKLTLELDALGVQLKDYSRGLIDFPSMREGRVVLLCWQLGEGEEIEWWHDLETGFAGRQPL
jgi:hypothetical protein